MSINNQLENFWNTLTGQTQEDARTKATNEANLAQVESTNQANRDIAHETNEANLAIARENLGYQRELQEYNKALQQQIFEREDTSYQRTAKDMLAAGLNPLSMQGTNGAGEAIAMSPLENTAQMQNGAPMQAAQFQKAQTMMSPIQALSNFSSILGTVINSVEQVKTGSIQRDSLNQSMLLNRLGFNLENGGKGYKINNNGNIVFDNNLFSKYIESKSKESDYNISKMANDIREWEHMQKAGKYYSDNKYEQIITAVEDWLVNGRGEEAWNKLCDKYPLLKILTPWAREYNQKTYDEMSSEEKKEWSDSVNDSVKKAESTNQYLKSSSKSKSQYR